MPESNLALVCASLQIKLTAVCAGYDPDINAAEGKRWPHFSWSVRLECEGRSHTTTYRTGTGHVTPVPRIFMSHDSDRNRAHAWLRHSKAPKIPSAADILSCLLSDAQCANDTFADFCSELGYDTDSRSALETYLACQATGIAMRKLLGVHYTVVCEAAQDY